MLENALRCGAAANIAQAYKAELEGVFFCDFLIYHLYNFFHVKKEDSKNRKNITENETSHITIGMAIKLHFTFG